MSESRGRMEESLERWRYVLERRGMKVWMRHGQLDRRSRSSARGQVYITGVNHLKQWTVHERWKLECSMAEEMEMSVGGDLWQRDSKSEKEGLKDDRLAMMYVLEIMALKTKGGWSYQSWRWSDFQVGNECEWIVRLVLARQRLRGKAQIVWPCAEEG